MLKIRRLILSAVVLLFGGCLLESGELHAQSLFGEMYEDEDMSVVQPQDRSHNVKFYFVMGSSDLVFHYGPNLMQRQQFDSLTKHVAGQKVAKIDSVVMIAYTAPSDSKIGTRELAEARLVSVREYVQRALEHNEIQGCLVISRVFSAEEAGADDPMMHGEDPWLSGDDVYNKVRRVDVGVYMSSSKGEVAVRQVESRVNVTSELTDMMADTISAAQRERQLAAIMTNPYPVWNPHARKGTVDNTVKTPKVRERYTGPINQVFSINTNLPYWLALVPNGDIEFYIGGRISLQVSGALGYWNKRTDNGDQGIYIAGVSPELRYWFNPDKSQPGHLIGLYGQYADYDIKLNDVGRQGYVMGGGISYGYYLPVGRRWAFEFGVGIGYLANKMDVYQWNPIVKKNLWVSYSEKPWVGPTKLNVKVIFRIGHKKRQF